MAERSELAAIPSLPSNVMLQAAYAAGLAALCQQAAAGALTASCCIFGLYSPNDAGIPYAYAATLADPNWGVRS